ncbi:hypothetical protein DPMN_170258 [Dreissena polymorpha]|uniref:Uncharacterized protein n=1 Tax=Dreissena polymorpha TaxID=45954 RepID=A0A9D4IE38_DREPO|nr:hypothetical protein DPMN_170258 [Dreissena polymorpha]
MNSNLSSGRNNTHQVVELQGVAIVVVVMVDIVEVEEKYWIEVVKCLQKSYSGCAKCLVIEFVAWLCKKSRYISSGCRSACDNIDSESSDSRCANSLCISPHFRCDGKEECPEAESDDARHCTPRSKYFDGIDDGIDDGDDDDNDDSPRTAPGCSSDSG